MSQAVPDVQHEFWRPPASRPGVVVSPTVDACTGCGSEYMVGAHFCYLCGRARGHASSGKARMRALTLLRVFDFQSVRFSLGLGWVSMVAFLSGLGCIAVALLRGAVYSAHNPEQMQVLQLSRLQWLLGSVASFVAALLLNRPEPESSK